MSPLHVQQPSCHSDHCSHTSGLSQTSCNIHSLHLVSKVVKRVSSSSGASPEFTRKMYHHTIHLVSIDNISRNLVFLQLNNSLIHAFLPCNFTFHIFSASPSFQDHWGCKLIRSSRRCIWGRAHNITSMYSQWCTTTRTALFFPCRDSSNRGGLFFVCLVTPLSLVLNHRTLNQHTFLLSIVCYTMHPVATSSSPYALRFDNQLPLLTVHIPD